MEVMSQLQTMLVSGSIDRLLPRLWLRFLSLLITLPLCPCIRNCVMRVSRADYITLGQQREGSLHSEAVINMPTHRRRPAQKVCSVLMPPLAIGISSCRHT